MFKAKQSTAQRSRSLLKKQDGRALRSEILNQFPRLAEEELGGLMTGKCVVTEVKLVSKIVLYLIDDIPYFFDISAVDGATKTTSGTQTGKGFTKGGGMGGHKYNLYPTIFALWRFPTMLRCFVVHPPVSSFLLKGADLMLPGLSTTRDLEGMEKGEKMSIRVLGNPLPFAVGDCLINHLTLLQFGKKGRGLSIVHMFGDSLSLEVKGVVPNNGFGVGGIKAICEEVVDAYVEDKDDDDEGEEEELSGNEEDKIEEGTLNSSLEALNEQHDESSSRAEDNDKGDIGVEVDDGDDSIDLNSLDLELEEAAHLDSDEIDVPKMSCEEDTSSFSHKSLHSSKHEIDTAVQIGFLRALRYFVKDSNLPILPSALWAISLKCWKEGGGVEGTGECQDFGGKLDIKRSTYRKVSNLLASMQSNGLITLGDEGDIVKVFRDHPWLRREGVKVADVENFKKRVKEGGSEGGKEWKADGDVGDEANKGITLKQAMELRAVNGIETSVAMRKGTSMHCVDLYKMNKCHRAIFIDNLKGKVERNERSWVCIESSIRGEFGEALTGSEVRDILVMYMKEKGWECSWNRSCVSVDDTDPLFDVALAAWKREKTHISPPVIASSEKSPPTPPPTNIFTTSSTADASSWVVGHEESWGEEDETKFNESIYDDPEEIVENEEVEGLTANTQTNVGGVWVSPVIDHGKVLSQGKKGGMLGEMEQGKPKTWKPISLSSANTIVKSKKSANVLPKHSDNKILSPSSPSSAHTEGPIIVTKEAILKEFLRSMASYHAIVQPNGVVTVSSGRPPIVNINLEARQGNKVVTRIRGLESFGVDLSSFAKDCQKKFACAASVGAVNGISHQKEIVIQGNLQFEIENFLVSQLKLPKGIIDITIHKGVKVKKKN